MESTNAAPTSAKIQKLVTGFRCEEIGCYDMAAWFAVSGSLSFHWCSKHTKRYMRDGEFWANKVAPQVKTK
jgi:hypothetical protein